MKVLFLAVALIVLLAGSAMAWDTPTAFGGYHVLEADSGNYFSHIQATWVSGSLFAPTAAVVRLDNKNPYRASTDKAAAYGAVTTDWTAWTNADGKSFTLDTTHTAMYKSIYEDWYFQGTGQQSAVFDMSVWNGSTCVGAQRIFVYTYVPYLTSGLLSTSAQTRFDNPSAVPEPSALALGALAAPLLALRRRKG